MSDAVSDKPLVSVIVPVYNVEAYLDRCVESLVAQTLTDIEIILVDDGSTDGSPAMCDAWTEKDPRIRVVHKENGGPSGARNAGVAVAKAEWIGFVDSDDHVSREMYELLYKHVTDTGAGMAICGICNVYANRKEVPKRSDFSVFTSEETIKLCLHGDLISVTPVNRLYPAWIFEKVLFPENKTVEDAYTAVDFLLQVDNVAIDFQPLYYYEHREGTESTHPYDERNYDVVEAYEHNIDLIRKHCPSAIELAEFRCYWARFIVLDAMNVEGAKRDEARRKEIVAYLRSHYSDIMRNQYVGKARKIAMTSLMVNRHLYDGLSKMQRRRIANQ